MNLFECPIHNQDFGKGSKETCVDCIRITNIQKQQQHMRKLRPLAKRINLRPHVSWLKQDIVDGGRVLEHIAPEPVFVRNKDEMRAALKRTHSVEK